MVRSSPPSSAPRARLSGTGAGRLRPRHLRRAHQPTTVAEADLCQRFGFSRVRDPRGHQIASQGLAGLRRVGTLVLAPTRWNLFVTRTSSATACRSGITNPVMSRDLMECSTSSSRGCAPGRPARQRRRPSQSARGLRGHGPAVAGEGDVEADLAFHTIILSACGNQFLRQCRGHGRPAAVNFEKSSPKSLAGLPTRYPCTRQFEAIERGDAEATKRAALVLIDAEEDLREVAP